MTPPANERKKIRNPLRRGCRPTKMTRIVRGKVHDVCGNGALSGWQRGEGTKRDDKSGNRKRKGKHANLRSLQRRRSRLGKLFQCVNTSVEPGRSSKRNDSVRTRDEEAHVPYRKLWKSERKKNAIVETDELKKRTSDRQGKVRKKLGSAVPPADQPEGGQPHLVQNQEKQGEAPQERIVSPRRHKDCLPGVAVRRGGGG